MTWFIAFLATAVMSAIAAGALAALQLVGLQSTPSAQAVLAAQCGVFIACRWWLAVRVTAALARPASRESPEPDWLQGAILWLAEAAPRWLLGYALMLGVVVWAASPLLDRGAMWTAAWGLGLLATVSFVAAALAPNRAWRLGLPFAADGGE